MQWTGGKPKKTQKGSSIENERRCKYVSDKLFYLLDWIFYVNLKPVFSLKMCVISVKTLHSNNQTIFFVKSPLIAATNQELATKIVVFFWFSWISIAGFEHDERFVKTRETIKRKIPGCEIQDVGTSISLKSKVEETSPEDDESDKHLEARDRRYPSLIFVKSTIQRKLQQQDLVYLIFVKSIANDNCHSTVWKSTKKRDHNLLHKNQQIFRQRFY